MARVRNPKSKSLKVDFKDTEASGIVEEGDYIVEVDEVELKTSDNSREDYLSFTMKITEGEFKGKKLFHNSSLQPQALFNLRAVLEALGLEVPQGEMDLDPADLIGESCNVSVVHEKYEGKLKARIAEFYGDEEEEEEKPLTKSKEAPKEEEPPAKKTRTKKVKEPEFEVGSKVTFEDDDGEEQTGKITEMDGDSATVKVGKDEWELELSDLTLA